MLRIRTILDADAAKGYYQQSDYYLEVPGDWLGEGAQRMGLRGRAGQEAFEALCDGIHPATGQCLTAKNVEGRRVGWDFNFNASKSVGIAREMIGAVDPAEGQWIEDAHREAVAYAMSHVEGDMQCRVRADGQDEDRITGNLVAMRVTHRTTRPNEDDKTPDMELHDHVVVVNATFDDSEGKIKAAQIGAIWHDAAYYEAIYHNRLAGNLRELGYGIRRKGKGFEIAGVTDDLIDRYSRRKKAIEKRAEELGIEDAEAKARLGAMTRLNKVDSRIEELAAYWDGKLSEEEREQLRHLKGQPSFTSDAGRAVEYAISHLFERRSVVEARKVYETAIRHGIGSVTPHAVMAEAQRQGLLVKGGMATTQEVLDQEARLIGFARQGRGTCRPLGAEAEIPLEGLSTEQKRAVRHIWDSTDKMILVEGDAGTGKTDAMQVTIPGIDRPGVFLAPSASASRGTLREKGFANADTIARFLVDEKFQEQARNGFIYVDEAPLAGIASMVALCEKAEALNARLIIQGDRKQHASVDRGGVFPLLEGFAGLPVARMADIWRQKNDAYKQAVAAIAQGDVLGGYDRLNDLGWIRQTPVFDHNQPLVDAYMEAVKDKASVLVVAPTHREGEEIAGALRQRLKAAGIVGQEERRFPTLKSLGWTAAERGDVAARAEGGEVIQFGRNSGPYKAGQRIEAAAFEPGKVKPEHFNVYQTGEIALAKGDTIRITANGKDKTGKHKLNNGATYQVAGFSQGGDIRLSNGWTLAKEYGHFTHGLVMTSQASQGATMDRVLIAMGHESRPAMSAAQFYVSVSRGRQRAEIFTDLSPASLREAVQRGDGRMLASELMGGQQADAAGAPAEPTPARAPAARAKSFAEHVAETYRQLRRKAKSAIQEAIGQREPAYER